MSSAQHLRDFISERLTAAAVEIFSVFQQTIVQYEEEIDRQRKLLDHSWKPEIRQLTETKQCVCNKEEVCYEQHFHNQQRSLSPNQVEPSPSQIKEEQDEPEPGDIIEDREKSEPLQIKEEQDELCARQEGDQRAMKQEPDVFIVSLTYGESDRSETASEGEQLLHRDSPTADNQNQRGNEHMSSESSAHVELNLEQEAHKHGTHSSVVSAPLFGVQSGTDSAKKSAKCGFCGKTFTRKSQLKKHHRIHTGERPYACETCGKGFTSNDKLLVHMRIHTGEKPYLCNTCGKRFTDPSALRRHVGIHTGKKPHSCKTCGKSFRQRGHLIVHLRIHTGEKPFICTICGKRFIQTSNLKSHMRIHTGEKRYSCEFCGKSFGHNHSMLYHVKTQHK